MKYRFLSSLVLLIITSLSVSAQNTTAGRISGYITDKNSLKPIPGLTVQLQPTGSTTTTDTLGFFRITNVPPGTYNLNVSGINYIPKVMSNILLTSGNETTISIEMEMSSKNLTEIIIQNKRNTARATSLESPLSVQRMTTEEIKRNPGGNFDISKVIQSLPGVGGGVGVGGF
jgi:hypothetical protein